MALIGRLIDMVGGAKTWGVAFSGTAARFGSGLHYTSTSGVMAHYTPGPCMLATETDFLQAYEDVLEKYKGISLCMFSMTLCAEGRL